MEILLVFTYNPSGVYKSTPNGNLRKKSGRTLWIQMYSILGCSWQYEESTSISNRTFFLLFFWYYVTKMD